jgi:hypothetical protein
MFKMARTGLAVALIGVVVIGIGIGYYLNLYIPQTTSTPTTVSGLDRPSQIPQVDGWFKGNDVKYWDFRNNPSISAPILVFFQASNPDTPVAGQMNIIDTIPGTPGYSDFWRVHKVLVPSGYQANSVTSFEGVLEAGYSVQETDFVVNCPVVNPGTMLQGSSKTLTQGWYRGMQVFYFDFGTNSPVIDWDVSTAPIYAIFFGDGTAVTGQHNIIDVVPGNPGYSDLCKVVMVTVGNSYTADTFKSAADVMAAVNSGQATLTSTNILVNCPVG